jgi:hypothetical protein
MESITLREALSTEHETLLRVIYEPFAATGTWPIWQYVELSLDAHGLDAVSLLDAISTVRHPSTWGMKYSLVWYMNPGTAPNADQQIALTVAGLRHIPDAAALIDTLLRTVEFLVAEQRKVIPSPTRVVEATVTSKQMIDHLVQLSIEGRAAAPVEMIMNKLYELFSHEPILHIGVHRPDPAEPDWQLRVPWALRDLRDVDTVDEYLDRVVAYVAPSFVEPLSQPEREPDLPSAIGYANAVWRSRTGHDLFGNFDPTSIVRLTHASASEYDFNSLLSALADVLGQVVAPGVAAAPQRGALEAFRDAVVPMFEIDAGERIREAIVQLTVIRRLRVSTQHADARHRAVNAFNELGLPFPPPSWEVAWSQVANLADTCLTTLREEALTNLSSDMPGSASLTDGVN